MKPAASIVLFTALSGAGYGLLFLTATLSLFGGFDGEGAAAARASLLWALALITAGLLSSTAHLGRPERAWRAFSQWRSSWLSREGVAALACYAPASALLLAWFGGSSSSIAALLSAVLAATTVYCTAMIYHQLETVPRWRHRLTPACFLSLALASGAPMGFAIALLFDGPALAMGAIAVIASAGAWWAKLRWWAETDGAPPRLRAGEALGLDPNVEVRLLEPPHVGANYLLDEMAFRVARKHRRVLRHWALIGGLVAAPAACLAAILLEGGIFATLIALCASVAALLAVLVERWLFFAEAKHVVTTYYGSRAV